MENETRRNPVKGREVRLPGRSVRVMRWEESPDDVTLLFQKRFTLESMGDYRMVSEIYPDRISLTKNRRSIRNRIDLSYEAAVALRDCLVSLIPYENNRRKIK